MSTALLDEPAPWTPPSPLPAERSTDRLVLRFWRPDDAPAMLHALDVDRESFYPWLPWPRTDNRTVDECTASIERFRAKRERTDATPEDFVLGIFCRATGIPLGGTGLHRIVHAAHEAEIGYWMRADRRREGLCTEAVRTLIEWSFAPASEGGWGLRRLHIRCAGRNVSSARVPEKLGLRAEARLVGERWLNGIGWDDTLIWGVLRDEWLARAH